MVGQGFAAADTSQSVMSKLIGGISFSMLNQSNWQGVYFNSYSFATDADYNFTKTRTLSRDLLTLKLELGFTRILDSLWYKHADQLSGQYIFKMGRKKTSQTATCLLNAKLLNSFNYSVHPHTGKKIKNKTGSFFNPSTFESGYGIGYTFLKQSIVNFSLATARLRILHDTEILVQDGIINVTHFGHNQVVFDYGFSLQYNILHDLSKLISFNSTGKMFLKGVDNNKVEMDISQKWILKITKNLHMKTDVKLVYAPLISHKMQMRNELMFGFYLDQTKGNSK